MTANFADWHGFGAIRAGGLSEDRIASLCSKAINGFDPGPTCRGFRVGKRSCPQVRNLPAGLVPIPRSAGFRRARRDGVPAWACSGATVATSLEMADNKYRMWAEAAPRRHIGSDRFNEFKD